MKVIAINGSPKPKGNTWSCIRKVFDVLEEAGIETEIIQIGNKPIRSCIACNKCREELGKCTLGADGLNDVLDKIREADGLLLASPVHYAGVSGAMKCFCDRLFYVASATDDILRHKVGAALVAVRRTGGSTALDCLLKYLHYPEMMVATGNYWPVVHGMMPGEADGDEEGQQILRVMAKNMVWLLNLRAQGLSDAPAPETKVRMNFIR